MDENEAFRLRDCVDFSVLVGSFFAVEVSALTFVNVFYDLLGLGELFQLRFAYRPAVEVFPWRGFTSRPFKH